jgi:hypothetical protein
MANAKDSNGMPTPPDVFVGGTVKPNLDFSRFDQHYATDQPVGPEPDEPSGSEPAVDGTAATGTTKGN